MWYSYNLELLEDNKIKTFSNELYETFFNLSEGKNKNKFIEKNLIKNLKRCHSFEKMLIEIYDEYIKLTETQKKYYKTALINNHKLKEASEGRITLVTYEDLKENCSEIFKDKIKFFFEYLYDNLKETESFKSSYISPLEYYQLMKKKKIIKQTCPFCGISQFSMEEENYREDFDHYLAKSIYPFLSLDYKNLVPMCKTCNQNYKKDKNINKESLYFYPFDTDMGKNELFIKSEKRGEVEEVLIKNEYDKKDEIETWDKIFNIKERSTAKINEIFLEMIREANYNSGNITKMIEIKERNKHSGLKLFEISILKYFKDTDYLENKFIKDKDMDMDLI